VTRVTSAYRHDRYSGAGVDPATSRSRLATPDLRTTMATTKPARTSRPRPELHSRHRHRLRHLEHGGHEGCAGGCADASWAAGGRSRRRGGGAAASQLGGPCAVRAGSAGGGPFVRGSTARSAALATAGGSGTSAALPRFPGRGGRGGRALRRCPRRSRGWLPRSVAQAGRGTPERSRSGWSSHGWPSAGPGVAGGSGRGWVTPAARSGGDELRRGVLEDTVDDAGPVEAGHHRHPTRDLGRLEPAGLLHPADVQVEVRTGSRQRVQSSVCTPQQERLRDRS
jgi:hypothetical protein